MQSYKFISKGRVQGVYYRKNICENAQKENFKGYVKNLPNGDVESVITVTTIQEHERFIEILQIGSPNSIVEEIEILEHKEIFEDVFIIKYD